MAFQVIVFQVIGIRVHPEKPVIFAIYSKTVGIVESSFNQYAPIISIHVGDFNFVIYTSVAPVHQSVEAFKYDTDTNVMTIINKCNTFIFIHLYPNAVNGLGLTGN